MQSRRIGLAHTWDAPKRCFQYSYVPRYNDTLEIVELYNGTRHDLNGDRLDFGTPVQLQTLPPEIQAEINISLGSSGMYYYTRTWWERKVVDLRAWQHRAGIRLKIWGLKLQIGRNKIRIAGIAIKYTILKVPLKARMAGNWCKLRYLDAKVWVLDLLIGDDQ